MSIHLKYTLPLLKTWGKSSTWGKSGVGNLRPTKPPEEKIKLMNIVGTFTGIVDAARDKNHYSFSARGGKKVAHHWGI